MPCVSEDLGNVQRWSERKSIDKRDQGVLGDLESKVVSAFDILVPVNCRGIKLDAISWIQEESPIHEELDILVSNFRSLKLSEVESNFVELVLSSVLLEELVDVSLQGAGYSGLNLADHLFEDTPME